MKKIPFTAVLLSVFSSLVIAQPQSQNPSSSGETRPRVTQPASAQTASPEPKVRPDAENNDPSAKGTIVGNKPESRPLAAGPSATERHVEPLAASSRVLSPPQ